MNTGRKAAGQFLFWLLLGTAAGVFLAAVLSYHEYQTTARLAGTVLRMDIRSDSQEPEERARMLSGALKESSRQFRKNGEEFLEAYGYRPMRNWEAYLPFTAGICILLFLTAGTVLFIIRYHEELQRERRIRELTDYLRAVNAGEGAVLRRKEDIFSHLEDEIYKTVMELGSTKEAAVRNHEVLADRIADIAHQLKTPLTSMSLMTELLEEYQTSETKEYYHRLSNQIERLKHLVSGLLSLAKLDSHGIVFHIEKLELLELIESAAEPLETVMSEKHIRLMVTKEKTAHEAGCFIYADSQWTQEALLNILKNCVEHTPEGGRITAVCSQNPIYTEVRIEDGGSGFEKGDLPHLFERFYRGAGAQKDNAGIGLALAKAVLKQQNGEIFAENTADRHACFILKWYASGETRKTHIPGPGPNRNYPASLS